MLLRLRLRPPVVHPTNKASATKDKTNHHKAIPKDKHKHKDKKSKKKRRRHKTKDIDTFDIELLTYYPARESTFDPAHQDNASADTSHPCGAVRRADKERTEASARAARTILSSFNRGADKERAGTITVPLKKRRTG